MQVWNKWCYNSEGKLLGGLSKHNEDAKWDESNAGGRERVGEEPWSMEWEREIERKSLGSGVYLPGNSGKTYNIENRSVWSGQIDNVMELWINLAHLRLQPPGVAVQLKLPVGKNLPMQTTTVLIYSKKCVTALSSQSNVTK